MSNPTDDAVAAPVDDAKRTDENRIDRAELIAAIVLGIAAVLTAWSSFRGSLTSDLVVVNYSEMQTKIAESTDTYGNGDQLRSMEETYFINFALQANAAEGDNAGASNAAYLLEAMGPEMAAAVNWWGDQPDEAGYTTPFVEDNPELVNLPSSQQYAAGDESLAEAQTLREKAEKADADSDRFEMANVFFAVTLFLAGVGTLVGNRRITWGLLALGGVMTATGVVVLITTPGWSSLS